MGILNIKSKASSYGKLDMEGSRLGSYVGGKRGGALFLLVWHASWVVEWGEIYGSQIFDWYIKFVSYMYPSSLGLDVGNIEFKDYAVAYFYVLVGLVPFVIGFCISSSYFHFRIARVESIKVPLWVVVSNFILFSAIIAGLVHLTCFYDGLPIPSFAAESTYYYTGFVLMLLWGFGVAIFIVFYIAFSLFIENKY